MRWVPLGVLLCLMASCSNSADLSEQHARATAEALIASNSSHIRDFRGLEWQHLNRVSPVEARGTAVMVYKFRLPDGTMGEERIPGTFGYRKSGQDWVLEFVNFPNTNNLYHRLDRQVFVPVTSAEIAPGALDGQLFAQSDSLATEEPLAGGGEARETLGPEDAVSNSSPVPLSSATARDAALSYLSRVTPTVGAWSANNFRAIRSMNANELELPATLLVETEQDTLDYRGGFFFNYDPEARKWMLSRLSFRASGSDPIDEALASPVPVD